jgi:cyanophycin synthetase
VRQGREICTQATDDRIAHRLSRIGYTLETIPLEGESVTLLDNANLSTGGESHDITEEIHPDFVHLAQEAAETLGLRLAGVDILADDLTLPRSQNEHIAIIELNGAP